MARIRWRLRSAAVLLVQVRGVRALERLGEHLLGDLHGLTAGAQLRKNAGQPNGPQTDIEDRGPHLAAGAQIIQRGSQQAEKLLVGLVCAEANARPPRRDNPARRPARNRTARRTATRSARSRRGWNQIAVFAFVVGHVDAGQPLQAGAERASWACERGAPHRAACPDHG